MAANNAAWRVPVVVRPLDVTFALSRLLVVPAVVFVGALASVKAVANVGSAYRLVLAATLIVLYILVMQLDGVEQRVDRFVAIARRRVALSCDHNYPHAHRDGLACRLTAEAFRAPVFRYEAQQAAVTALVRACDVADGGQFWFVEGTSGSGKTRAALLLIQTLLRDATRFELGGRCYLYDFADAGSVQDDLIRWLGKPQNDRVVVLVDNFQLVRADVLQAVTQQLVDSPGNTTEQLIVFLARPGEAWNLSPGAEVRIVSEAKSAHRHFELAGARSEDVERRVAALDRSVAVQLRALSDEPLASAAQLHFAQIVVRKGAVPDDLRDLIGLLSGSSAVERDDLLRAMGTVAAMTVHRGMFRPRELRNLVRQGAAGSRIAAVLQARRDVRRLHRVGLVTKLNLRHPGFGFHEAIAELCVDRLARYPAFDESFRALALSRLATLQERNEPLGAWLVGAEIGMQEVLVDTFDAAIARGAYSRMVRCLRRADARYSLTEQSRLQLAILSDRVGDFADSRALVNRTQIRGGRLNAMLTAQRIESNHAAESSEDAAALRASSDIGVALIGEYWELHIAAHRGEFAPERLRALASELRRSSGNHDDYWTVHALSRMHFDSLRHHYLAGGQPVGELTSSDRRAVEDFLRDRLPTFEALHTLYNKAHLVGHVLLPRLAIFDEPISPEHAALAELAAGESRSVSPLTDATHRLYRRARDEFWQYGDREASYLTADILNARMIQVDVDLSAFAQDLRTYEEFIEGTGFQDLRSYPQLYFARWHVLRHFASLVRVDAEVSGIDGHLDLDRAAQRLSRALDFDRAVGNEYGVHRVQLLQLLLDSLRSQSPLDPVAIGSLHEHMVTRNYGFEAELLSYLLRTSPVPLATLLAVFRYYPIVHQ